MQIFGQVQTAIRVTGAISSLGDAIYFALVTTTLGNGDITLARDFRNFGAIAAVAELLTFGLGTAFLIGAMEAALTGSR